MKNSMKHFGLAVGT